MLDRDDYPESDLTGKIIGIALGVHILKGNKKEDRLDFEFRKE